MNQMIKSPKSPILKLCLLLLVLLSLFSIGSVFADDDEPFEAVPNQVVVKLIPGAKIKQFNRTYKTTTIADLAPGRQVYLLAARNGTDMSALIERMKDDSRVVYVEPNYITEMPEGGRRSAWGWGGQDAEPYGEQYALDMIHLTAAHSLSQGAGVVVAVIDTGAQLNHPALAGSFTAAKLDLIDGDQVPNDVGNGRDDDGDGEVDEGMGHGTHVAGTVHLVAPQAQIMPIRVLDSEARGNVFAIAEAILFALENGADVINLSLGTGAVSEVLQGATEEAADQGVLVIAAAGNLNSDLFQYPAGDDCVLAITSVGSTKAKSTFSNYGSWISLSAPGESIYSPFPVNGYAWWSGTSMATPFAAGQAALLWGYDSTLSLEEVVRYMGGTAQSLKDANPNWDGKLGVGLVDAGAALQALASGTAVQSPDLLNDNCLSG